MTAILCPHCRYYKTGRCDATHCDRAISGPPGTPGQCWTCWVRLRPVLHLRERVKGWPAPIRALAQRRKPEDRGVGDTFARIVEPRGGNLFKRLFKAAGVDCGCAARQEWLNKRYSYEEQKPDPPADDTRHTALPPSRTVVQLKCEGDGIGDHLLALTVTAGMKRSLPSAEIVLGCRRASSVPWVNLFAGYDRAVHPPLSDVPTAKTHEHDRGNPCGPRGRWEDYAREVNVRPELPVVKPLSDGSLAWASRYAGAVVLAPWSAYRERTWPLVKWLELERKVIDSGGHCVILDDQWPRNVPFLSERVIAAPPDHVAALLGVAKILISNDSGMAHVAGLLRAPAVALCGPVLGRVVFGFYPSVRWHDARDGRLVTVTVGEAMATAWLTDGGDFAQNRVLRRLAESRPRSYLEIGVKDGGSLRCVLEKHHPERLVLADEWGMDDGGTGRGNHAHVEWLLARLGYVGEVSWLDGDSHRTLPALAASCVAPFDLITVDADHSAEGARADLENAFTLLAPDGAIVFDDVYNLSYLYLEKVCRAFLARHADVLTLELDDREGHGVMVFRRRS